VHPQQLEQDLYWKHLHGFWCTLPNFNPHTALSEPDQDLAAEVLALLQGQGVQNNDNSDDDLDPSHANDGEGDTGGTAGDIHFHSLFIVRT